MLTAFEYDDVIGLRYALPPMTAEETSSYMRHHLALAGRSDALFSDDAAALIHGAIVCILSGGQQMGNSSPPKRPTWSCPRATPRSSSARSARRAQVVVLADSI